MKINVFVLLALLVLTTACERSSKPLPPAELSAQSYASRYTLKCENNPCLLQAGLMVGKIGMQTWTCTVFVAGQPNVVLVNTPCVQAILDSGGGCINKVAVRFLQSAETLTCVSVTPVDEQLSSIELRESLPYAAMIQGPLLLAQSQKLKRVGFQVDGYHATQESRSCEPIYGSMLNPTRQDHKSSALLLQGCANSAGMKSSGLVNENEALLSLISDQADKKLKAASLQINWGSELDLQNLTLTNNLSADYDDPLITLDNQGALPELKQSIQIEMARENAYFKWQPKLVNIGASGTVTTLVPSCAKEQVFADLNEKRWRGLSRAVSGGLVLNLTLSAWVLVKKLDSFGRPFFALNPSLNLPVFAELTNPSSDNQYVDLVFVQRDHSPVWAQAKLAKCKEGRP